VQSSGTLGEVISLGFSNTPSEGFNYIFTFGDGTDILNDPSSTLNSYTDPTISHIYNTGGTYYVNMVAWNSFYVSVCSHEISISAAHVPIRDVVLTPSLSDPPIALPFKDRTMEFSYEMIVNNPDPTNVTCMHIFGDTMDIYTVKTNIIFRTPVVKVHTYINKGTVTVNFTCYNEVSSVVLITKVSIIDVFPDDYIISYPLKNRMNTTMIPPVDEVSDPLFLDEQQKVTFQVELKRRSLKVPPGADIEFDFGDMTNTEELQDVVYGDTISHIYTERGIYTVTMNTTAENGETASKTFNIQIGLTDLVISSYTELD
jgi:PKD repeat protein